MKKFLTTLSTIALFATIARADTTPLAGSTKVQLCDLPAAAKNAIKAQGVAASIEYIENSTINGRTVYEAAFKRNGQHTELRVSDDGTVLDTIVAGQSTTTGGESVAKTETATSTTSQNGTSLDQQLGFSQPLRNASKVSLNQVPAKVQNVMKQRAGQARIEDIDKGMINGDVVYQAAYKKNGKHTELRVNDDATFVREAQAGNVIYSHDGATARAKGVGYEHPLENAQTIALTDAPANVQQIVKQRLGNAEITQVRKGTIMRPNNPIYQVTYKQNGQIGQLRVSPDGNFVKQTLAGRVVFEGAGAEVK